MNTPNRPRARLGININKITSVAGRGQAICNGFSADKVTYASPNPPLSGLLTLLGNLSSAQSLVSTRTKGMAASRDVQRDLLIMGLRSELLYVQNLVDTSAPSRGVALIENAGMLVAAAPVHTKAVLSLALGKASGSVVCSASVGLLLGTGASMPKQLRFFNWQYTLDGKTFVNAPPTSTWKTTLLGLPLLTVVGVRVNLNNAEGPGPWSQVVTITVH